ncbi:acyl-CoA N-acyltransferase [Flagelloscypha sp. PMI_526]|nr:acyl-CoA N-acyltransferase [Flagelloscypha sp. PMI_526]
MSSKFTPDSSLDLLFNPALISPEVKKALPDDLHMRPLASTDYARSHMSVLRVLTQAPDVSPSAWQSQFQALKACPGTYYTLVIVSKPTDTIVGVGSLFIERKFLRGLGSVGHIEDIAVDKSQQGKKLGLRVINALTYISESMSCYKTILNCSENNVPFYEKCGFVKKEVEMTKYAPEQFSRPSTPRL